jgi:C4-dicarboxylate-specific signal transduction histidine kinase
MIATHQKDEHIVITLQDTGIGIDDYLLPQIFEPFITSKLPGEGTGLGLAITRSAIAEMGGDIKVENVPEGGARFTICLKKA